MDLMQGSYQWKYKLAGPQGQIMEHIISCTMEYEQDEIVIDCVEIEI